MPKDADARYLFGLLLPCGERPHGRSSPDEHMSALGYESDSSCEILSAELVLRDTPLGVSTQETNHETA